ncbi:(1-3)-beta-glucanase [Paramecium bursaria Chlorella virus CvsA1]|nr:(1-3)-beta-glucanase [Paramecium bursaria Chlorella virus CvsA1]
MTDDAYIDKLMIHILLGIIYHINYRMVFSLLLTTSLFVFANASRGLRQFPIDNSIVPSINDIYNYTLVWNDEFVGNIVDSTKWTYDISPSNYNMKNQQQVYTTNETNVRVYNGNLEITALNDNGYITSGWVDSRRKFDFFPDVANNINGVLLETRLKLPHPGQGFWPCVWLNPTNISRYGASPGSGEIDLMETINDMKTMFPTMHWGGPTPETKGKAWDKILPSSETWADDYHVYSLYWEVDTITMFIDGDEVLQVRSKSVDPNGWYTAYPGAGENAPFDAPFYIIMNFAIGGNWPNPSDDTTIFPATMYVDYVRVFYT